MMRRNSLRWRLSLTYAGIALLTALVLGAVLLAILRSYYQSMERAYLIGNADATSAIISESIAQGVPLEVLQVQVESLAFFSRARIRLMDRAGNAIADSGPLPEQQMMAIHVQQAPGLAGGAVGAGDSYVWTIAAAPPGMVANSQPMSGVASTEQSVMGQSFVRSGPGPGGAEGDVMIVLPTVDTLYGFNFQLSEESPDQRSELIVTAPVIGITGEILGYVQLSEGPAYGTLLLRAVARGFELAALIAVVLAAILGWWVSRRISAPILALADVTWRMAGGDFSARTQLQRSDEIGVLAQSFNEMAGRIEATVSMLRNLVTDAAHELQTPLTALRTNLDMALDEPDAAKREAYLKHADDQLQRFTLLTANLLALSKIEAGIPSTDREDVVLNDLLREQSEVYASRAEQFDQNFEVAIPDEAVKSHVSAGQIQRALDNLLENAIKFTPSGGTIRLKLEGDSDEARIAVEDTGIGIEETDQGRVFERFHRGRNAAAFPGSGLGLAIVRAIITEHHGAVKVEAANPGTRVLVTLKRMDV